MRVWYFWACNHYRQLTLNTELLYDPLVALKVVVADIKAQYYFNAFFTLRLFFIKTFRPCKRVSFGQNSFHLAFYSLNLMYTPQKRCMKRNNIRSHEILQSHDLSYLFLPASVVGVKVIWDLEYKNRNKIQHLPRKYQTYVFTDMAQLSMSICFKVRIKSRYSFFSQRSLRCAVYICKYTPSNWT